MEASATVERPAGDLSDLQLSPEEQERELEELRESDPERFAALEAERAAALEAAQAEAAGEGQGEGEGGETAAAAAPAEPEDPGAVSGPIVVRGTAQKGKKWSGKAPASILIALRGVRFEAEGGFDKGTVFRFSGSARVISEGAVDKLDKDTKLPSESVQRHEAQVLDFEVLSD